ncbi:MAG: DegT/DnrJ/EryC1/StrS family aminotransferase [bacterium]|nr:DegT/DnrJ/EryC1/StrS family aminotransferase [bacterium]
MKRPIAISLSPNTSQDDVALAWRLLFLHMYWKDKKILSRAAESIVRLFPGHFVTLTSSGRQALFDLMRSYSITKGDEVIVQAFTCIAVPEPILWTGATPIYADIAKDSYSFDPEDVKKKITQRTKAIIVQHTFGIPGPIEEIVALAKEHNIIVIEDCALALGVLHNGKMLGTFGDAAILSFGRDKCISSIYGGAVITKDIHRTKTLQAMQNARQLPPKKWVLQQLFHVVLFAFVLPIYFWYGMGKALLVLAQKLHLISRAYSVEERKGKRPDHIDYSYSPALGLLLLKQLEKLDAMNTRRQEIVSRYEKELSVPTPGVGNVCLPLLRYPVQVDNPREILLDAKVHNMLLGDWYDAPLVPGSASMANFQYEKGSCPVSEETAKHIINLPTYASLTDTQVTSIIAFMNQYGNTGN